MLVLCLCFTMVQHSFLGFYCTLSLEAHLGMRVPVTTLTPKLMHKPHKFTQNVPLTVAVADPAVFIVICSLSSSWTVLLL